MIVRKMSDAEVSACAAKVKDYYNYRVHADPGFILAMQKEELARIRSAKIFFLIRRLCFIVLLLLIIFNSR